MNKHAKWDSEVDIDRLIAENDETFMPLPDIECEPHLLISKVRKHYMEYMIKILTTNYETNQRLVNKNIYLPHAIWRCAKNLEMKAAQACMVIQLYRKCIVTVINEVKTNTQKGKLYNKLYDSLRNEPQNEKKTQTVVTGDCQCQCIEKKRRRKRLATPKPDNTVIKLDQSKSDFSKRVEELSALLQKNNTLTDNVTQRIPVLTNMQTDYMPVTYPTDEVSSTQQLVDLNMNPPATQQLVGLNTNPPASQQSLGLIINPSATTPKNTETDDLMQQMEKLFQSDNNEDDLFTNTFIEDNSTKINGAVNTMQDSSVGQDTTNSFIGSLNNTQGSIIEDHAAQIKSLDARLATLTGLLVNKEVAIVSQPQKVIQRKAKHASKWQCEEYFSKKNLFELLYQIADNNRMKLARIKELYRQLFGEDSDDEEEIMSPVETPEFVASCKSRIGGWVMTILAPYYAKGRIQGKMLYKSVAKHLIELIYKCKQYPSRHEVTCFVMDFLENHGKIRCEADFKEFRIDNVHVVPNYSLV